jgi:hypothetical protein
MPILGFSFRNTRDGNDPAKRKMVFMVRQTYYGGLLADCSL